MSTPCVSIGVPIFNEGEYLEQSLNSLVSQSYENIEIIICNNASTDDSEDICKRLQASDHRIQYCCSESNIGAIANFEKALQMADGKYFMWASGHDLWSANLINECVEMLEAKPDAALAFGSTRWIDDDGELSGRFSGWTDTQGLDEVARFMSVLFGNMHPILGVMRTEFLRSSKFYRTIGTDLLLLSQMCLKGHFVHAVKAECWRREFSSRATEHHNARMKRYQSKEYNLIPTSPLTRIFPLIKLPFMIFGTVLVSEISWLKKMVILALLVPALPIKYVLGRFARKNADSQGSQTGS